MLIFPTRGKHMDGAPAQQHGADPSATLSGCVSAFGSLRLLISRGAAAGCHQPVRALRTGTVLPLQEVPPPQHFG